MSSREDLNKPRNVEVENLSELRRSPTPGIEATPDSVRFLGVELPKCQGGPNTPNIALFERDALTKMDLELMQQLAATWSLNQIPCVEGGPGIGKTHTVQRMGAYLNQEVFKVVCDPETLPSMLFGKVTTNPRSENGFGFVPGIVVEAMQRGGILFLDEYNALPHESKLRLRDAFDAMASGQRSFLLKENSEEPGMKVEIHPNFRVAMAQNEPDGSSPILHPLPEPDFSRVAYMKYPEKLPAAIEEARFLGQLGVMPELDISEADMLRRNPDFSKEKLAELLGDVETKKQYVRMYQEFTSAISTLVERMEIGKDQSQPISFNSQRDWNRVIDFVSAFYDGDLQSTTQKALKFYFQNRFEDPVDRARVGELIDKFQLDTGRAAGRVELPPEQNGFRAAEAPRLRPGAVPDHTLIESSISQIKPLERLLIGRTPRELRDGQGYSEMLIDVSPMRSSVSRQHAAIELDRSGTLSVWDLNSSYGTAVIRASGGGELEPVTKGGMTTIEPGDEVILGHLGVQSLSFTVPDLVNGPIHRL